MNAGQREATTRFSTRTQRLRVGRDTRSDSQATVMLLQVWPGDSVLLTARAGGVLRVEYLIPPGAVGRSASDVERESLWNLARSAPRQARVGMRWVDTLRVDAVSPDSRRALNGTRVSRVLRDTVVGGRTMMIVRDSASVTYEVHWNARAFSLERTDSVERRATGVIRGQWLLDPEHGYAQWSADTTTLRGTATLMMSDGRTASSPTRFERTRQVDALTPVQVAASLSGEQPFSIVRLPSTALEKRLDREGPRIVDSLLAVARASRNPFERDQLLEALRTWGRIPRERLTREMLLDGDTVRALEFTSLSMTPAWLHDWLPLFDDPAPLWRHGLTPTENFSEGVESDLTQWPPVLMEYMKRLGRPIPFDGACLPDACRVLAELWPSARDARLRAIGLLTRAMQDPKVWGDSLRRYASIAPGIANHGIALLDGVGASWQASTKIRMPAPGADWRLWSEWMTGQSLSAPPSRFEPGLTRLEENHYSAFAIRTATTGRDFQSEMRDAFQRATADSARLVFGTLAVSLNAIPLTGEVLASWLSDSSALITALGRNAVTQYVSANQRRLPDAEAVPLIDTLLAILTQGAPRWASLGIDSSKLRDFPAELRAGALRIISDSLPAAVIARWSATIKPIPSSERGVPEGQLQQPVTTYWIAPPIGAGPIVVLQYRLTTQRGQQAYSQGAAFFLLRVGNAYRLVSISSWIT